MSKVLRTDDDLAFAGELADAFLVPAEGEAFVEAGRFLALELTHIPIGLCRFDFVKAAFVPVLDGHEHDIMRPTEGEWGFARRCLANLRNLLLPFNEEGSH